MPTNHESRAAFPIGASLASKTLARNLTVGRYAYFVAIGESPQDLVAIDPDTGAIIPAIMYSNVLFWYDSTDTTTAHDGVTTIVSYDGLRYKTADVFGNLGPTTLDFTGKTITAGTFNGPTLNNALCTGTFSPATNDGAALGTTSLKWSDLFLASGAVINFNSGDVTITHSADALTFAGATTGGYKFDADILPVSAGVPSLGNSSTPFNTLYLKSGGVINFNNGDVTITHAADTLTFASATTVGYKFDADILPVTSGVPSLGNGSLPFGNLFLKSGSVVNFNNGDVTITHAADTLTFAGATTGGYKFDADILPTVSGTPSLGSGASNFGNLFLKSGGVVNFNNGDIILTHSSDLLTLTGGSFMSAVNIGGSGTGSTLSLRSTSGVGATDQILFQVGNNGGTLGGLVNTTGRWSVGATNVAPDSLMTVMANTAATVAPSTGTHLHIVGADAAATRLLLDNFGSSNVINARHASGTLASKTATANAQTMFAFGVAGWDGSAYYNTSSLNFVSTELFSGTAGGAEIQFYVTPNGSHTVTQSMTLRPDGGLTIGGSGVTSTGFGGIHAAGGIQSDAACISFTGTAIPAGGTTGSGMKLSSTSNFGVFFGSGAPTLSAAKGSLYLRSDGTTTNDRIYVNTNGSTTWTALTSVA